MFYTTGIDVGSSAIKCVLLQHIENDPEPHFIALDMEKIRKRNTKDVIVQSYGNLLSKANLTAEDIAYVATTGEGEMVDFRRGHFYSMTSHSRGALYLSSTARAVVDVGALHTRAMLIDHRSKILSSRMTSQCASGSGQFLENISRYLGVAIQDIGELSNKADQPEVVSSICAVLAETDVINMVSRGISTSNILKGIHISMARRIINLLRLLKAEGEVLITGGLSQDIGLLATIQELADQDVMKISVKKHENSIYAGAIGAALWAGYRHIRLLDRNIA